MQKFALQDHHIRFGHIPDEALSLYAGHPVVFMSLDSFAYWDKMAAGVKLTPQERNARLFDVIIALNRRPGWGWRKLSQMVKAETISTSRCAATIPCLSRARPHRGTVHYFDALRQNGIDSDATLSKTPNFFPGEERYFVFPVLTHGESRSAVNMKAPRLSLFLRDNTEDAGNYWRRLLDIPADRLKHTPRDGMHLIFTEAHEMRHMRQITAKSPMGITHFYGEADADFFAHQTLAEKDVGRETRTAAHHARYYNMLKPSPVYWIGPMLDALKQGAEPPSFAAVYKAVSEIYIRIGLECAGRPHRAFTSADLQHFVNCRTFHSSENYRVSNRMAAVINAGEKTYMENLESLLTQQPELLFSTLRDLVETGAFTAPLAHRIAVKIIDAAAHFNPDLPYEPNARLKLTLFASPSSPGPA